jgi:hypothetical protein
MSDIRSCVNITTEGTVTTFDRHGVRIKDLSGNLTILHKIIKIVTMSSKDRAKLPSTLKIYNPTFFIVKETTGENINVPIQHLIAFAEYIEKNDVEEFIEKLLLQVPK